MRKIITSLLLFLCFYLPAMAQTGSLKGKIIDTLEKKNLANAVVSLINKKDSTLAQFTRSDKNGAFEMPVIAAGQYMLLVTFPKFADYVDEIDVKAGAEKIVAPIALTNKSELLKEVVIRGGAAIRIKGDTTEFTADSFVVREGATVEDLLKKLPGFQVNSKGEITAQGKRVEKVLVDGEEFFGDDPTMATQNLSAKAVDKVQLFEAKTDQQQLTGISTGNEGKTLNIKLKEDKKKGAFGKVNAGTDFTKYYDTKALYNKFVGKRKVSAYGSKTNVTTGSLNWEDRQKLGIEDDFEYDEISGFYFSYGGGDEFNEWSFRGLPNAYTAGGLYIDKWNSDKQSLNTSYRYNRLGTENKTSRYVQSILNNTINYRNTFSDNRGYNQQHAFNGKYEWKVDSLTSFKFSTAAVHKTSEMFTNTESEYLNGAREAINTSLQQRASDTRRLQSDNQLTYKQLFKKKNRQLLATLRFGVTDDDNNSNLQTRSQFYKRGVLDSVDVIDQQKTFAGQSTTIGTKITYSEPLSSKWNTIIDYSINKNNATSVRNTFNKDNNGKYEVLDAAYSNHFDLDVLSNSGSVIARYVNKKLRMSFGSGASNLKLQLFNKDSNSRKTYTFFKVTPQAQLNYAFKQQTSLSLSYRGTTRQPTIDQLQPIRDNSDNLNVFVGNPNLKVGFNHSVNLFFNQFKMLAGRYVYASVYYSSTQNAITNYTFIDTLRGKQVYTPINVNGNRNWGFWGNWNKGQGEKKLNYGIQLNANGGRNVNYINQNNVVRKNITDYSNFNLGFNVDYSESEKVSINVRPTVGYNLTKSSLQPNVNNNYYSYGGNLNGFIMLPGKLELSADANIELRQKLPQFPVNSNLVIVNANLARKVFKKKTGKIILAANDLLDQNKGYERSISSNFISEERYARISRYFLLKFEWSFSKLPGSK